MAKKEFAYRGKKLEELLSMSLSDFIKMLPSRQRRSMERLINAKEGEKRLKFYKSIKKAIASKSKKPLKTHCREFVILPEMVGLLIMVYNGKEFVPVEIKDRMIGHILGEFALTRGQVNHSAPGIGATRSTKFVSVRA
ncbi:MAG: 30S ribosomal protein S19 [Candidatus Altiarchaeota archaeon]|nr:30S ribosomal protein S19 [Candidatus Altiarchaeota archaeon]